MADIFTPIIGILISTIVIGSIYSLVSTSLSLLWSTVGLPNFAHGALIVTGAYISWYLATITGIPFAIFLMIPIIFAFGLFCDRVLFKRIRYEPNAVLRLFLITITLAVVIQQLFNIVFSGFPRHIPRLIEGSAEFGGFTVPYENLLVVVFAVVTLVALYVILSKTVTGLAIRALGQSMQESLVVGVNVELVYSITVAIGFVLAGVAGMLLGSLYLFNAAYGDSQLFIGYLIAVFGGLGNIKGTIYGAYTIAAIQGMTTLFIGGAWTIAVPFLAMIIILIIRPYGLFGVKEEVK